MRLILGTAQLTERYGVMASRGPAPARPHDLLEAAFSLGVNALDTAPSYGTSEDIIGDAGSGFAVHTKIAPRVEPATSLAASLRRLRRDSVEVLHIHDAEALLSERESPVVAAAALVGEGAGAIGASIYTHDQFVAAAHDQRISVIQAPINLLNREISDEDLCFAAQNKTEVLARSVLLQGLLGNPDQAKGRVPGLDGVLDVFLAVAADVGKAPIELAIGWVRARQGVAGMVVGAESPEQLERIVAAFNAPPIPNDVLGLLTNLPIPHAHEVDPRTWISTPER